MAKKAQGTLEYTLMIGVFVAAIIVMQKYMQGGIHGRFKGQAASLSAGRLYTPKYASGSTSVTKTISEASSGTVKNTTAEVITNSTFDYSSQGNEQQWFPTAGGAYE